MKYRRIHVRFFIIRTATNVVAVISGKETSLKFQPVKISSPRIEFGDSMKNILVVVTIRADLNHSFVSTLSGVSRHVLK